MTPAPTLQELIDTVKADAPADQPLQQLTQAWRTVADLEEVSDALLGHFVDRCRRGGHSWSEISAALGISKQAAHKRFSPGPTGAPSFERFTPRARMVLSGAADQARRRGGETVGTEHLLLALFEPRDSVAARALAAAGLTPALVEDHLGPAAAPGRAADGEPIPYAPATVDALRSTVVVALELGHNYIGTEHLLLALYQDQDTPAARALAALGARRDQIQAHIEDFFAQLGKG